MKFGRIFLITIVTSLFGTHAIVFAAPIGVPGATTGVNQSTVGLELNFLVDRDLAAPSDTEGMMVLAKGQVGVTERLDLLYRLGFGRFESAGKDSDAGLSFGFGTKVTWASIDNLHLKIGSVAQVLQVRADVDGGGRQGFTEYDLALGAYVDSEGLNTSANRTVLAPYGGFVLSGLEIDQSGAPVVLEDDSFGLFAGILIKLDKKTEAGIELRLLEQTALAIYTSFAF